MGERPDLLVLGAGPAGVGAALAAAKVGVDTVIVDRAPAAGGQVYRAPRFAAEFSDPASTYGNRLREALTKSPAETVFGCRIWSVDGDFRVDGIDSCGPRTWWPKTIVVAVGTTERVIPFQGWTLPGVYGLAATTLLLKSEALLPGNRTVVAGSGPLLAAVAQGIVAGGGEVAAVVDSASSGEWLASIPALLSRPKDLRRGLSWVIDIKRAKIPIYFRHAVTEVTDRGDGLSVTVAPVDDSGRCVARKPVISLTADSLSIGNGLTPSTEITRLLRADHVYNASAGGWVPVVGHGQRTSVKGLYAAGDGTGIAGADAALLEGKIAGYQVARDLELIDDPTYRRLTTGLTARLEKAARAGHRMARMMTPRQGQITSIAATTVVCRCEDITRGEIEAAIDDGAADINQVKSWTRCGMGPCQGRTCGDVVAEIIAQRLGGREKVGCWSARTPLVAIDMESLSGKFTYHDIPIPEAAPL